MESWNSSAATVRLHGPLQAAQRRGPELREELIEDLEPVRVDDVETALALLADVDKTSIGEDLKVLREGLLRDVEVLADLAGRAGLVAHEAQHRLPPRLGQRA